MGTTITKTLTLLFFVHMMNWGSYGSHGYTQSICFTLHARFSELPTSIYTSLSPSIMAVRKVKYHGHFVNWACWFSCLIFQVLKKKEMLARVHIYFLHLGFKHIPFAVTNIKMIENIVPSDFKLTLIFLHHTQVVKHIFSIFSF